MASAGIGSGPHAASELFKMMAGLNLVHVLSRLRRSGNYVAISSKDAPRVPRVSKTDSDPMKIALSLVLAPVTTTALAEPLPQPKPQGPGGSCPHGYLASGSFCVPSQRARDAIAKPPNGTCPWGWIASGSYCLG
jgi:hypothetical protein